MGHDDTLLCLWLLIRVVHNFAANLQYLFSSGIVSGGKYGGLDHKKPEFCSCSAAGMLNDLEQGIPPGCTSFALVK